MKQKLNDKNTLKKQQSWIVAAVSVLLLGYFVFSLQNFHHDYSVLFFYVDAARHWLLEQNLYRGNGYGFIYLPQSAILTIPFAFFKTPIQAELAWRAFWFILSGITFYHLAKITPIKNPEKQASYFFLLIFFFVTVGADTLRNGQMNVAMMVLFFATTIAVFDEKWFRVAFFLNLGLLLKTTFIVYYLLFFAIFPKIRIKLIYLFLLSWLIPFLLAKPSFVWKQYHDAFLNLFTSADYSTLTAKHFSEFSQAFTMLYAFHVYIPALPQTLIRLIMSIVTLYLSYIIFYSKRFENRLKKFIILRSDEANKNEISNDDFCLKNKVLYHRLMMFYTVATIYLLLFNPRTENNDYMLLSPILVWFWVFGVFYSSFEKNSNSNSNSNEDVKENIASIAQYSSINNAKPSIFYKVKSFCFKGFENLIVKNKMLFFHGVQFVLLIFIIFHHDLSQFLMPPFTIWLSPLATILWLVQAFYFFMIKRNDDDTSN